MIKGIPIPVLAQPGDIPDPRNPVPPKSQSDAILNWTATMFDRITNELEGLPSDTVPDSGGMNQSETLLKEVFSKGQPENNNSPVIAALEWFWAQNIPAPIVLLLMICLVIYMHTRSVRNTLHFWKQLGLFVVRLVWMTPVVILELLLSNRLVDSPYLLWILVFWHGFAIGILKSLYELFTGRRWRPRVLVDDPLPPLSPPPTPPRPLSPPPTLPREPRSLEDFIQELELHDYPTGVIDQMYRVAYLRDVRAREEWERRVDEALEVARDYHRRRRAHEARVVDRERIEGERERRRNEEEQLPETPDRTGRQPRMLRGEVGHWWPWARVALAGVAVIGFVLGFVYYCQSFEPGDECGWFPEVLCGGGGVGSFENLRYDDQVIRETVVAGQGPPRFRVLSDGTKIQLPNY
ncbi:hypothetical protein EV127DRAFT_193516 [Xylaria flabelliformis]|nr:hypothetical protein EV127DRAFT_193516 [Xylaria flabelliformis]